MLSVNRFRKSYPVRFSLRSNRRAFPITIKSDAPIASAQRIGLISPAAASGTAAALYGRELKTSVSALEQFLGCPFHYVAARALRTEEREEFEAVKEMARLAREENEALRKKLEELENKLGKTP